METAEIQASLQSPLFSRLVEDGDRRCDLIWASPVTLHFFPLYVLKCCSPLILVYRRHLKVAYATCYFCKHYFSAKFTEYYSIRLLRVRVKGE